MSDFSTGLFACCSDCMLCVYGFFCAWCLMLRNSRMIFGSTVCNCCDCMLGFVSPYVQRQVIRAQRGMEQTSCKDCLVSSFCLTCANCQHARELEHLGLVRPTFKCCDQAVLTAVPPVAGQGQMPRDI